MEDVISTNEAAAVLGVSASRVLALIKSGRLPAIQMSRFYVVRRNDLALVSDRKPGRPKKPDEGEPDAPVETPAATPETKLATRKARLSTTAKPKTKTAGKGTTETKPAQKRTAKKGKK